MKMEKLKKDNRKKIIIGVVTAILLIMGVVGFVGTKAKYKYTATIPIVSGTIHYKSGDLSVVAVNIENDSGGYTESDNIPSEGYILNREKSYCGLSNGDGTYTNEAVTMNYHDGVMAFDNVAKKGTKCFLYFNKPNYLVVSKTEDEANNDVLGKEIARSSFESITTVASKNVPAGVIDSWDASVRQNGSIMAWYTDTNNNGLYELYIGQDDGVIANPNSEWLFSDYTNVTNIDVSKLDTSNVTSMEAMFAETGLTSLDLSNFDTSKVTTMVSMFSGLRSLTNLNISSFNTSKVTNMVAMFRNTSSLVNLDLSHFNTSNVTIMQSMFGLMTSLKNLNLSSFDTSNVTDMNWMFCGIPTLQTLNLNEAVFVNVLFYDGVFWDSNVSSIIVKDANAKEFINARLIEAGKTSNVIIET